MVSNVPCFKAEIKWMIEEKSKDYYECVNEIAAKIHFLEAKFHFHIELMQKCSFPRLVV